MKCSSQLLLIQKWVLKFSFEKNLLWYTDNIHTPEGMSSVYKHMLISRCLTATGNREHPFPAQCLCGFQGPLNMRTSPQRAISGWSPRAADAAVDLGPWPGRRKWEEGKGFGRFAATAGPCPSHPLRTLKQRGGQLRSRKCNRIFYRLWCDCIFAFKHLFWNYFDTFGLWV